MKPNDEKKNNLNDQWQSGVRYTEERVYGKNTKLIFFIIMMLISALLGGIIGGYLVKRNFNGFSYMFQNTNVSGNLESGSETANIPKSVITKISEKLAPSIVGISSAPKDWISEIKGNSLGSGIIFDKEGYIVTNEHIIAGQNNIIVTLSGGKKVPAKLVGKDSESDVAVLKIEVNNLTPLKFGNSDKVRVGDSVIAMGNPSGEELSGCISAGVISGTNKAIEIDNDLYKVFRTDANIDVGNSGGALVNEAGEVIGINNAKLSNTLSSSGYALPINEARPIIDSIIKNGGLNKPFLGIKFSVIDSEMESRYKIPAGVGITEVVKSSPCEKAGVKAGDIITSIDDVPITRESDVSDVLYGKQSGDKVTLKIHRDGKDIMVNVPLSNRQ